MSRWGLLVDHPPCVQAEIWRGESSHRRRPDFGQRVDGEIPGRSTGHLKCPQCRIEWGRKYIDCCCCCPSLKEAVIDIGSETMILITWIHSSFSSDHQRPESQSQNLRELQMKTIIFLIVQLENSAYMTEVLTQSKTIITDYSIFQEYKMHAVVLLYFLQTQNEWPHFIN